MATTPDPDTVPCRYADCLLSDDLRDGLVGMVTITSSLSILLCTYVIVTIQAYQRYRFQPQRFVRTIFVANLLFAFAWAQPFHHYASWPALDHLWRTEAYCAVNIFFQGTRFGSLFLEIRLVLYTIYCEYFQREGISSRTESLTHAACWIGGVIVGFSFFAACMAVTPRPYVPSRTLHDDTSFAFFACVGVVAVLRLVLYILTLKYQSLWREHQESFSSPIAVPPPAPLTPDGRLASVAAADSKRASVLLAEQAAHSSVASSTTPAASTAAAAAAATAAAGDATPLSLPSYAGKSDAAHAEQGGPDSSEPVHTEPDGSERDDARLISSTMVAPTAAKADKVAERRVYDSVVKPLRWYPTLFLLFVLPQILITITDDEVPERHNQMLSRTILAIFIPFRGFCLSLVFIANNKALVRPAALLERLKARFNAFNLKRDKISKETLRERLISQSATPDEPALPTEMWSRTLRETI